MRSRYIVIFELEDRIFSAHGEDADGKSKTLVFDSFARACKYIGENRIFSRVPYQIVKLDLKEATRG